MNGGCDGGSTEKAFAQPAEQTSSSAGEASSDQSGDSSDDPVKTDDAAAAYPAPAADPSADPAPATDPAPADTQVNEVSVDSPQAPDLQAPAAYPEPGQ